MERTAWPLLLVITTYLFWYIADTDRRTGVPAEAGSAKMVGSRRDALGKGAVGQVLVIVWNVPLLLILRRG